MLMRYFKVFEDLGLSLFRYIIVFIQAVVCILSTQIFKSRSNICSFVVGRAINKYYHESTVLYHNRNTEIGYYSLFS